jgi:hypothetical protein
LKIKCTLEVRGLFRLRKDNTQNQLSQLKIVPYYMIQNFPLFHYWQCYMFAVNVNNYTNKNIIIQAALFTVRKITTQNILLYTV